MKRSLLTLALFALGAAPALAQDPELAPPEAPPAGVTSLASGSLTPDMWFYEQEKSAYNNPKAMVRARAEYRSEQRLKRMANMKWYGYSNQRPTMLPTPWWGTASPTWVGNSWDPYHWRGPLYPSASVRQRTQLR